MARNFNKISKGGEVVSALPFTSKVLGSTPCVDIPVLLKSSPHVKREKSKVFHVLTQVSPSSDVDNGPIVNAWYKAVAVSVTLTVEKLINK